MTPSEQIKFDMLAKMLAPDIGGLSSGAPAETTGLDKSGPPLARYFEPPPMGAPDKRQMLLDMLAQNGPPPASDAPSQDMSAEPAQPLGWQGTPEQDFGRELSMGMGRSAPTEFEQWQQGGARPQSTPIQIGTHPDAAGMPGVANIANTPEQLAQPAETGPLANASDEALGYFARNKWAFNKLTPVQQAQVKQEIERRIAPYQKPEEPDYAYQDGMWFDKNNPASGPVWGADESTEANGHDAGICLRQESGLPRDIPGLPEGESRSWPHAGK